MSDAPATPSPAVAAEAWEPTYPLAFDPAAHRRFWSVQALRVCAAYGVVIAHFAATQDGGHTVLQGVDIFFVLSGFLIWVITSRVRPTPWAFMFNRLTRLAPLYWLATAIGVTLKLLFPATYYQFSLNLRHIVLSLLFVPHIDPHSGLYPFIGQGWTLNLDVFYYLLFAGCLLVPRRWRAGALTVVFAACVAFGVLARAHHNGPVTQSFSHPIMLAFPGGVWIAEAWLRGWLRAKRTGAVLAVAGFALYGLCAARGVPYSGWSMAPWIAASCMALTGFLCMEGAGVRLEQPWLERLGDWSYAIYLFHQIIMMLVLAVARDRPLLGFGLLLAGSTASGWAGYVLFERPANRLFRRIEKAHAGLALRLRRQRLDPDASLTELAP